MSGFYDGKRVLVTGGVGFIGSNLAIRLVELGAEVVVVDSMLPAYGADLGSIAPVRDRVRLNFSDVRDRHSLSYLVRGQDLIFSLAGQVSHSESMKDPFTDLEINCLSQLSLLECCRQGNPGAKIVFASTRQLYGRPQYLPVDEAHPLLPVDVNGINKLAAERYYTLYHEVHGIDTVSLRLTNTYGPRMDLRSDVKGFVGIFVRKAMGGEKIQIYGTGKQRRDFNHVDDVVDAFLRAGASDSADGQAFNLGDETPVSLLDLVTLLLDVAEGGSYTLVPFPPERKRIDIGDFYADISKIRATLGWEPRRPLREGLAETVGFYREHRDQYL